MAFRSKIVGTWRMLSMKLVNDDGEGYPFGKNAEGSLVYSSDGYMSAVVRSGDVQPWVGGPMNPSADEAILLAPRVTSYSGKFFLDEKPGNRQIVWHEIRISLPPNFEGGMQKRNVEIRETGGGLNMTITTDNEVEMLGCRGHFEVEWQKMENNQAAMPS